MERTYVVEKPVAYKEKPLMIAPEVKLDGEIKMARKGDTIIAKSIDIIDGNWIEVADGGFLPIKYKSMECLVLLVAVQMRKSLASAGKSGFQGLVKEHLKKKRYPCSKCNKGNWETKYLSSADMAAGTGSPRDCDRCHGKRFTRCNLSQRSSMNRRVETDDNFEHLFRKNSMSTILGIIRQKTGEGNRRLMSLNTTPLRPSELALRRYRLMSRPKSHIVVLEDLLEKINAAKLAASHGA